MELKAKIEKLLSEILSDKHDCKITLTFKKKEEIENEEHCLQRHSQ